VPVDYKVLGQRNPAAATLEVIYTVPADTEAVASTLTVSNRSAVATSFRVRVAPAGAADNDVHSIYHDIAISGNDTFAATLGFALATTDEVRVYATLATLTFSLFGTEIT